MINLIIFYNKEINMSNAGFTAIQYMAMIMKA